MQPTILVTYATHCGSTREVAEVIAEELNAAVLPMSKVTDLSSYKAVIMGSPIHRKAWLPEAKAFVKQHQAELARQYTAFFTVCITLSEDTDAHRQTVETYLKPVRRIHEPNALGYFAGRLDYRQLTFVERLIAKNIRRFPEGDFRDWYAIRRWAKALHPLGSQAA